MSENAQGSFISTNGYKFIATFTIDGDDYIYAGSINPNIGPIEAVATIAYGSESDLAMTRSFTGRIGASKINIRIANGPIITGNLPASNHVDPAISVEGSGTWVIA
ncbi:hypothetical protein DFP72DRAFT_1014674 [Ephemerocybe angulata]|uniref:Uncharacterized protein n=1 Tax=Ephemerocybe angulata TaxID=980116 RepID=A0A8H6HL89_9AGAR|nr:hypothetical protein DFP72DRAFT_1014674 [Tulosesus angulatus]